MLEIDDDCRYEIGGGGGGGGSAGIASPVPAAVVPRHAMTVHGSEMRMAMNGTEHFAPIYLAGGELDGHYEGGGELDGRPVDRDLYALDRPR